LGIALGLVLIAGFGAISIMASDHDDGEVDTKGRNLNLTDLYAFREKDQNPSAADGNLVFIMNTNPRSLARQQYYFSTRARYEFKVTRVTNNDATPTGKPDVVLRFEFGAPNAYNQQQVKLTAIRDGNAYNATGVTTPPPPLTKYP
jgi:glycogen debranching enzyme